MNAFGLPKNDPVAARIAGAATRGALSHALLLTGSGERLATARYAAATLECTAEGQKPCGECEACRKVMADIHPDVITVVDEQHKDISVDVIRAIRSDAYIRPNEGRRKVYLFPDCARLTDRDQNVLLKIVEEGPPYAAFVFCAENPAVVLQTLRSRCVELKTAAAAVGGEAAPEAALDLCRRIGEKKRGGIAALAVRLEKKKTSREDVAAILDRSRALFAQTLLSLYGGETDESDREITAFLSKNLTKGQIMSTIELLEMYHGECAYNVGSGHVLGALATELEGIL